MNTTIQVDVGTRNMLERIKKAYHVRTYDEAIGVLARKKSPSLFGGLACGKRVSVNEILHGLRDKSDRF